MRKKRILPNKKTSQELRPQYLLANNDLGQLGFDNSPLANIIFSLSSGKIIMVNKAAIKLFGYSKKIFLVKNKHELFDITENKLKKLLKLQTAIQKPVEMVAVKKGGKQFPCEMNYSLFKDAKGIKNAIISLEDMSQRISDQLSIDIKKEKIVSDNIIHAKSEQKNIDVKNKKIVIDNIVIARSKQKKIDTKKEKIVAQNIVLAKSKQKGIDDKNKKIVAHNINIAKSKQKTIDTRKKKIVDDNIIVAKTKSDREKTDYENTVRIKVLMEIEQGFRVIFDLSSDVLFDSDLVSDSVMINDAYEKEFGYKRAKKMAAADDWATHIHPDDKAGVMKDYNRMLRSTDIEWKIGYRFLRSDGSVANVLSSRIILRNPDNTAYRMIGSMQDISKQKVLEERLEREIRLKEVQISEAAEDAKDAERSDIGKELHDNVNQLLSASRLYLEMAKRGGIHSEMYLSRSSEYTLTAIEEIRKLSKGLTTDIIKNLGLCTAIENISHDTMETNAVKIILKIKGSLENTINDKFKLNIYRIIQEQLNNILKHAKATKVIIELLQDKSTVKLTISDNGIGFDTTKKRKGIGVANIKSRAASYNGTADFISQPGNGCVLTATFPASDKLLRRA